MRIGVRVKLVNGADIRKGHRRRQTWLLHFQNHGGQVLLWPPLIFKASVSGGQSSYLVAEGEENTKSAAVIRENVQSLYSLSSYGTLMLN